MRLVDQVREVMSYASSDEENKVDRMTLRALIEIEARAASGDSQCILGPCDYSVDDDPVSLDEARAVAKAVRAEGFEVEKAVTRGTFWVSWGDTVDQWWDSAL